MDRARIVFHLPEHRRRALKLQNDSLEAAQTYDASIGAYLQFLRDEARKQGFTVDTDQREDTSAAYSIEEHDHETKRAAHDWLDNQPDIWNWIP